MIIAPSPQIPGSILIAGALIIPSISLIATNNGNGNSTMRKINGAAGYTPSGANKFYLQAVRLSINDTLGQPNIGYSDNDVGINTATGYTNLKLFASMTASLMTAFVNTVANPYTEWYFPDPFAVPNGKFVAFQLGKNSICQIFGYEGA
jgi:hypothetical protein